MHIYGLKPHDTNGLLLSLSVCYVVGQMPISLYKYNVGCCESFVNVEKPATSCGPSCFKPMNRVYVTGGEYGRHSYCDLLLKPY